LYLLLSTKRTKIIVATRHDVWAQNVPNAFAAGAPYRVPLGELTALPRLPMDLGVRFAATQGGERERNGKEAGRKRKSKGRSEEEGRKEGDKRDGKGRQGAGVVILGGIDAPAFHNNSSSSDHHSCLL